MKQSHSYRLGIAAILSSMLWLGAAAGLAQPAISSFDPTYGPAQTMVQIYGSGFTSGTTNPVTVKFGNVTASAAVTATQPQQVITAYVPSGAVTGPQYISVAVPGKPTANSSGTFYVVGSGPFVSDFSPTTGGVGTSVTIDGLNFNSGSVVQFGGVAAMSYTERALNQIIVTVPAGANSGPVTVSTGSLSYSTPTNFYLPPVITGFSSSVPPGGTTSITGQNLTNATAVTINGTNVASFTVNSNTSITVTLQANASSGRVGVTTPWGTQFSVASNTVLPMITGFAPSVGGYPTNVVISGANLKGTGTPTVRFNGVLSPAVVSNNYSQVTAALPVAATTGPISVTTSDGTATSAGIFYVAPTISFFTPTNGAPGTLVTINGNNLTNATSVTFNGTAASFTVVNNTQITATAPAGGITGPITVTTPGGTASAGTFYYAPSISGFSPGDGYPGDSIAISGLNFLGVNSVLFNGVSASFTVTNNALIYAIVPATATTGPITVSATPGFGTSAASFVVDALLLSIGRMSNGVSISWPTNAVGFSLQYSTNLLPHAWTNSTNPTVISGVNYMVTNNFAGTNRFFRLAK